MSSNSALSSISNVNIDPAGRYKYILIKLSHNNEEKYVVRGFAWAGYHGIELDQFFFQLNLFNFYFV